MSTPERQHDHHYSMWCDLIKGANNLKKGSGDVKKYFDDLRKGSGSSKKEGDSLCNWFIDMKKDGCSRLDRRQQRLNTELLKATEEGNVDKVTTCLEHGASPDATCGPLEATACHLAALTGDCDIISLLLKCGASPRILDSEGRSPLHLASWSGNAQCLSILLKSAPDMINSKAGNRDAEKHIDVDILDSWNHDHECIKNQLPTFEPGSTALHIASQWLHLDCAKELVASGADIGAVDDCGMPPAYVTGEKLLDGFQRSTIKMFPEVLKFLFDAGATVVRETSNFRTTPMHTALALQSLEAITYITKIPGFTIRTDKSGATPLHLAISLRLEVPLRVLVQNVNSNVNYAENYYSYLEDSYVSVNNSTNNSGTLYSRVTPIDTKDSKGNSPLHEAVISEWRAGVGIFLEAGADIREKNSDGATTLHLAAESGNSDILEELLNIHESKSMLNELDSRGETPLFRAVLSKSVTCVKLLLDAGANMKYMLPDKVNILHRSSECDSSEVLEEILKRDHKLQMLNQTEVNGMTPLHVACLVGSAQCVQILLSARCDVNMRTSFESHTERTALHLACSEGHSKVVELLLKYNSSTSFIESRDAQGYTPLHLACQNGNRECISQLLLSGADLSAKIKKSKTTAMHLLFLNIFQPIVFLEEILDSHININEFPLNDPRCVVTVDYRLLVPRAKTNKQMKVLNALFDTGINCKQETLVLHPMVESFLYLKWRSWKTTFYHYFLIYVVFMASFSSHVVIVYHLKDNDISSPDWFSIYNTKIMVLLTVCWLMSLELQAAYRLPKYYFTDLESWLKWSSYTLASVVAGFTEKELGEWHRMMAVLGVLLVWSELMFQLTKNPKWSYYINMFSKVAHNVLKVLATFIFLIIGFALAFMVLFQSEIPFESPLEAFMKTVVMMTSDYEYSNLFFENKNVAFPIFGRFVFLIFILMVDMVLMNLLVGLAVSDIHTLETQGKMNRLRKQADFLRIIQPLDIDLRFIPKCFQKRMHGLRKVQPPVYIHPGNPQSIRQCGIPRHIIDALINRADAKKKEEKFTLKKLHKKLDILTTFFAQSDVNTNKNSRHQGEYIKDLEKEIDVQNESTLSCKERCGTLFLRRENVKTLQDIKSELTTIRTSIQEIGSFISQDCRIKVQ